MEKKKQKKECENDLLQCVYYNIINLWHIYTETKTPTITHTTHSLTHTNIHPHIENGIKCQQNVHLLKRRKANVYTNINPHTYITHAIHL